MMVDQREKVLGCIFGGAIGDSFGAIYEGSPAGAVVKPGKVLQLTDDTQLTLATCEAIAAEQGRIEVAGIARRFAEWHCARRVTGAGASTLGALTALVNGGHWALVGRKGERAAGNGAAMRIAPLAFCYDSQDPVARRAVRDVARITHHNEEAYVGALAVVLAVRAALDGSWATADSLLPLVSSQLPDTNVKDRLLLFEEIAPTLPLAEVAAQWGCSGYVVESVPLALYAANQAQWLGFEQMISQLIACGGDTDTIAAIAGQVVGTLAGHHQLPQHMLAQVPQSSLIKEIATAFADCLKV